MYLYILNNLTRHGLTVNYLIFLFLYGCADPKFHKKTDLILRRLVLIQDYHICSLKGSILSAIMRLAHGSGHPNHTATGADSICHIVFDMLMTYCNTAERYTAVNMWCLNSIWSPSRYFVSHLYNAGFVLPYILYSMHICMSWWMF